MDFPAVEARQGFHSVLESGYDVASKVYHLAVDNPLTRKCYEAFASVFKPLQGSQVKVCENLKEKEGLLSCLIDRSENIGDIQLDPSKCPGDFKFTLVKEALDDLFSLASLDEIVKGVTSGIEVLGESNGVVSLQYDYLPGLVIKVQREKWGYDEEANALLYSVPLSNMMRKLIRVEVMDLLEVPCKRLYHIPGTPSEISTDSYIVVEAKVDYLSEDETREKLGGLGKEEAKAYAQQLCSFIEKSGFRGCNLNNMFLSSDRRKLVIVQTEPHGNILLRQRSSRYQKLSGEQRENEMQLAKMGLQDLLNLPLNQEAVDESLQECFAMMSEESKSNRNKNNLVKAVPVIVFIFAMAVIMMGKLSREAG